MAGKIINIFVAAKYEATMTTQDNARLDADKGIVGDRYYGEDIDAQVTLVDADMIEQINRTTGWSLTSAETRRNIVTRGIDLNQWETARFRIGDAILEGVELCEPCAGLGGQLENDQRTAADVVKALTRGAGLRARVIEGAEIAIGDKVEPDQA